MDKPVVSRLPSGFVRTVVSTPTVCSVPTVDSVPTDGLFPAVGSVPTIGSIPPQRPIYTYNVRPAGANTIAVGQGI